MHHKIHNTSTAADRTPVEGGRMCTHCDRVKPLELFSWLPAKSRYHSWCRQCARIVQGLALAEDPVVADVRAAYEASERRKAMKREWHATRRDREKLRASRKALRDTPRGRLMHRRREARYRLRKATTDVRRAQIQSLIDRDTAAIAALDAEDDA